MRKKWIKFPGGKCPACDMQVSPLAKTCPYCAHTPTPPPYAKKSNRFYEVLDETVVEIDLPLHKAIAYLQEQSSVCHIEDSSREDIGFFCQENGNIFVYNQTGYRVCGRVVSENGKTVAKLYAIREKGVGVVRIIPIALCLLYYIGFIAVYLYNRHEIPDNPEIIRALTAPLIVGPAILCGAALITIKRTHHEKKNHTADLDTMKQEMLRRIRAIERWDEE